jgi:uncharacterized protein YdcH (DUF465 family)
MNITLRKANAVQNSIQETIKAIQTRLSIEINEFQDPAAELKKANDTVFAADHRRQKLLLALYNIRGLVGTANAQSGIDLKLATSAYVDKRVAQLDDIVKAKPMTELTVLNGKLEKIRNRKEDSRMSLYGREDAVETSVLAQEQIDQAKAEVQNLKKQKQKLNDEILELNIKTEIPLSDEVVATLQAEGLL